MSRISSSGKSTGFVVVVANALFRGAMVAVVVVDGGGGNFLVETPEAEQEIATCELT